MKPLSSCYVHGGGLCLNNCHAGFCAALFLHRVSFIDLSVFLVCEFLLCASEILGAGFQDKSEGTQDD